MKTPKQHAETVFGVECPHGHGLKRECVPCVAAMVSAAMDEERAYCADELERLIGLCSSEEVIRVLDAAAVFLRKHHQTAER